MILIRHGPVRDKYQGKVLGQLDISLQQLLRNRSVETPLSELYEGENTIYLTSPLSRATETCQLLGISNPIIEPRISEMNLGSYQGMDFSDNLYAEIHSLEEFPNNNWHGGESFAVFKNRVLSCIEEYRSKDEPVVMITHSGVIRLLLVHHYELKPTSWYPRHLEMVELESSDDQVTVIHTQLMVGMA